MADHFLLVDVEILYFCSKSRYLKNTAKLGNWETVLPIPQLGGIHRHLVPISCCTPNYLKEGRAQETPLETPIVPAPSAWTPTSSATFSILPLGLLGFPLHRNAPQLVIRR